MIVVLAVFLATLFSQSAGELREPVDCSKMDFTNLDKLCNKERKFGDLVPQSLMKKCIPKTNKDVAKWANMFMMQKLMNPKKNNSIELNTTKVDNILCPAANFINCVATSIGWLLPNGSYNKEAADVVLSMNKDERYSKTLLEINEIEHPTFDSVHVIAKKPYACPGAKKNSARVMTNIHPLLTLQHLHMYIPTFFLRDNCDDKKCQKNFEEFYHCAWNVYMNYDMNMRSQKEAESAIAMLEVLNKIVAKTFPNHKRVSLKRA